MTRLHRLLVLAAASLVAAAAVPAPADAAYQVRSCDADPAGANNAWTVAATQPDDVLTGFTQCRTAPTDPYGDLRQGIGIFDFITGGGGKYPAADDRYAEQRFTAPAGTRITGATITREIGNRDHYWLPYGRVDAADQPGDTCRAQSGQAFCHLLGTRTIAGLNAQQLAYGARCTNTWNQCVTGSTLHYIWVLISSATVTLDDTVAPTVGDPSGDLANGAWHNTAGTLSFTASDNTGIRSRRLVEAGTTRATASAPLAAAGGCGTPNTGSAYTYTQPCLGARGLNGTQTITADVCTWGSGTHTVRAGATDTGGTETLSANTATVKVDCAAPAVTVAATATATTVSVGDVVSPTVTASDAHAGVVGQDVEVQIDSAAWLPYTGPLSAQAGRSYRFRGRASDAAGNTSAWSTSPTITARGATGGGSGSGGGGGGGGGSGGGGSETVTAPVAAPVVLAPPAPIGPAALPVPAAAATRIRVGSVRASAQAGRLTVTGDVRGAPRSRRISLTASFRLHGRKRTVRRRVSAVRGRYRATLRLPRGVHGTVRVTATVGVGPKALTASRSLRLRRAH